MKARIYHNPRCSKSRATLALLQERGVEIEIVALLAAEPKLIERPIVEVGARARIGRPPEQVLDAGRDARGRATQGAVADAGMNARGRAMQGAIAEILQ